MLSEETPNIKILKKQSFNNFLWSNHLQETMRVLWFSIGICAHFSLSLSSLIFRALGPRYVQPAFLFILLLTPAYLYKLLPLAGSVLALDFFY